MKRIFILYTLQLITIFNIYSPLAANASGTALTFVESKKNPGLSIVSDVAVSTDGKFVYSVAVQSSAIAIFARDKSTGTLSEPQFIKIDTVPSLATAFSVAASHDNKNIYVASPTSVTANPSYRGSITAFSRDQATGALRVLSVHSSGENGIVLDGFIAVAVSPDDRNVYAVTGNNPDGLAVFSRDSSTGMLTLLEQHQNGENGNNLGQAFNQTTSPIKNIEISADGKFLYISSTEDNAVSVYLREPVTGALTFGRVYIDGVNGVTGTIGASSLKLSRDGKHLYVAGQSSNSVAIFSVNQATGELTYLDKVTQGVDGITSLQGVRSLSGSPDGKYIYAGAIGSNAVTAFARDSVTGLLAVDTVATNANGVSGLNSASGMQTDPQGRHLYVAGQGAEALVVFALPTPAIVVSRPSISAVVQGPAVVLDPDLIVLDADSTHLSSARITISNGFNPTDLLNIVAQSGISMTHDYNAGVMNLSGAATVADYQAMLRTLTFQAGADASLLAGGTTNRRISITVSDGANTSAPAQIDVAVTKIAAQPVIAMSHATVEATVEGAPVTLDASMTVIDTDSVQLASANVTISNGLVPTDALSVSNANGLTVSYSSGVLQIIGNATPAIYEAVLRTVQFSAGPDASLSHGQTSSRMLRITVSDGGLTSEPASIGVTVKKVVPQVVTGTPSGMSGLASATLTSPDAACILDPGSGFEPANTTPAHVDLPFGVFKFAASGCSAVTMTLEFPQPMPADAVFWKYGPADAGANTPTWFEWTGPLTISADRKSVSYVVLDNGVGDGNPAVGQVADPFAIGVKSSAPIAPTPVITSVPVNSVWALALISGLLGGYVWRGRKRFRLSR